MGNSILQLQLPFFHGQPTICVCILLQDTCLQDKAKVVLRRLVCYECTIDIRSATIENISTVFKWAELYIAILFKLNVPIYM